MPPLGALVVASRHEAEDGSAGADRKTGVVGCPVGHPVGLVALRPLGEPGICEMKRLYVTPRARGQGLGRLLCERLILEARRIGYRTMRLDTLPRLVAAGRTYGALGFRPIADYNGNPIEGVHFFEKDLTAARD